MTRKRVNTSPDKTDEQNDLDAHVIPTAKLLEIETVTFGDDVYDSRCPKTCRL